MMRLESPIAARAIKRTSGDMGEKARSQESGVRSQESGMGHSDNINFFS
jgi:hypothetical protein